MADSKVLKIIDDMSDYIDSHNAGPLSRDKIKISKDGLFNYIDRIRQTLPNELEEASKITKAKNEILKAAKNKAAQIETEAQHQLREMIKEDEVVVAADKEAELIIADAEKQADEIVKEAEEMANQIKIGALSYAEEMLATVEKMVSHNLDNTIASSNSVIDTLKNNLEIIQNNRDELNAQILEAKEVNGYSTEAGETEPGAENQEDEFSVNVEEEYFEEELGGSAENDDDRANKEEDELEDYEEDELYEIPAKFSLRKKDK